MKTINLSIVMTFCIFTAFFCGIFFEKSRKEILIKNTPTPRVYLEQLKTKINIRREGTVDIYLNGSRIQDDVVLDLKK